MRLLLLLAFASPLLLSCGPSPKDINAVYEARYSCSNLYVRRTVKRLLTEWFGTSRGLNPDWDVAPGIIDWTGDTTFIDSSADEETTVPLSHRRFVQPPTLSTSALGYQPDPSRYDAQERAKETQGQNRTTPGRFDHSARPKRGKDGPRPGEKLVVFATAERDGESLRVRLVGRTARKGTLAGPDAKIPEWAQQELDAIQMAVDKKLASCRVVKDANR